MAVLNDLTIDLTVACDVLQQQTTGGLPHQARLVLDGRKLRRDVLSMDIICKAYQSDIIGDAETELLNGGKGCEGDDIVESKDGIRTVFALQQTDSSIKRPLIVDAFADNEITVNGDAVLTQCLQIAMLTTTYHIKMVRTSYESDATTTGIDKMLGSLLGSHIAIGSNTGELLR